MATLKQIQQALSNPNAQNFLGFIANSEGVQHGYNTIFGNERFNDLSRHPNVRKQFKQTDGRTNTTTAAGRYQFLKPTWDEQARRYGLKDFSPQNQDIAALALIAQRGALDDVLKGNWRGAISKLGTVWASLPSSNYAQPKKSWAHADKFFGGNASPGSTEPRYVDLNALRKQQQPQQPQYMDLNQLRQQAEPKYVDLNALQQQQSPQQPNYIDLNALREQQ